MQDEMRELWRRGMDQPRAAHKLTLRIYTYRALLGLHEPSPDQSRWSPCATAVDIWPSEFRKSGRCHSRNDNRAWHCVAAPCQS